MSKDFIRSADVIGGRIRNVAGNGFSLDDFEKYANYLNGKEGGGDALIKFGKLPADATHAQERTVLRIASTDKDGWIACDIKNPLYRTAETEAVNNDVRRTFVNALNERYPLLDLKDIPGNIFEQLHIEDFVNEEGLLQIERSENFTLNDLFRLIGTNGTGKPISAGEILAISRELNDYAGVSDEQKRIVVQWGERLNMVLNRNYDVDLTKIQQIKEDTMILTNGILQCYRTSTNKPSCDLVAELLIDIRDQLDSPDLPAFIDRWSAGKPNAQNDPFVKLIKEACVKARTSYKDQLPPNEQEVIREFGSMMRNYLEGTNSDQVQGYLFTLSHKLAPSTGQQDDCVRNVLSRVSFRMCSSYVKKQHEDVAKLIDEEIDKQLLDQKRKLEQNLLLKAIKQEYRMVRDLHELNNLDMK